MNNSKNIKLNEIIWPYRPDILIRIDFLQWYSENKEKYFTKLTKVLTKEEILKKKVFFEEAKKHPYFLQFTRKCRYRKLNLAKEESENVYVEGIAALINLLNRIKKNGFDKRQKIQLRRALFLKNPDYGKKIKREYYIGDGCHRFACFAWLYRSTFFPRDLFRIQFKFSLKPVNAFGILKPLKVFNQEDEQKFDELFNSTNLPEWNKILYWTAEVRNRFKELNCDELFKIKFPK